MATSKYYTSFQTSLGTIILIAQNELLTGCYFENQKHFPILQNMISKPNLSVFILVKKQLEEYIAGERTTFDFPHVLSQGTEFQQKVWQSLTAIRHGTRMSYKELAIQLNAPSSVRAIANAVGKNPLSIIIPCHRIVGSNGSLTGYAGGIEKKKALLAIEGLLS